MGNIKSVLFVCTGNSCRSVMAEGLLKKRLADLGKNDIEVNSAGIMALTGFPPTQETVDVMKEAGVDVSGLKSKALTDEMIKTADLILVMEPLHKADVVNRAPEASSKTYLLHEFGNSGKSKEEYGVPDPIRKTIEYYKRCMRKIDEDIKRIAELI